MTVVKSLECIRDYWPGNTGGTSVIVGNLYWSLFMEASKAGSKTLVAAVAAAALAGCASILGGNQQTLSISTGEVAGAACKVEDVAGGFWYLPNTPTTVTLTKGNGPLAVVCEKEGYKTGSTSVDGRVAPKALVVQVPAAILLGLAGLGASLMWDSATGAIAEYPNAIVVPLEPTSDQVAENAAKKSGRPPPAELRARVQGLVRLSPLPVATMSAPVRTEASPIAKVVKVLSHGTRVDLVGSTPSGWLQVAEGGKPVGWIHWTAFPVPRQTIRN